jgi:hypothetical protein
MQKFPPKKTKHFSKDTIFAEENLLEIIFQSFFKQLYPAFWQPSLIIQE